ncbi:hypothetical protein JTE90_008612 [Oedothorax gibbosus]|uniref:Uncharacterized protein n=1 Tax=Oedothorax gibbosus TaxID=931172 RepID=A0AAV6UCI0_9ARAC|nr:hypothetical protein JTE90_008612 [Oedothorax gibbosus]
MGRCQWEMIAWGGKTIEITMPTLRAGTYLSPSIPVDYYEMLLHYVEQKLGIHSTLLYESRWEGPQNDREDPFLANTLDLAWMSSRAYQRIRKAGSPVELLPLSSIHEHVKNSKDAGHYADVIMHRDMSTKVKEFKDFRGCKWAFNGPESVSGHVVTLSVLKDMGVNASFFGNVLYSGSYLESIRMVIGKKVEAAAVDANCLKFFQERNPELAKEVEVFTSWGPLPPYPIVVNSKMEASLKSSLCQCLLNMHRDIEGRKKLQEYHVRQFVPITMQDFDIEDVMIENTKGLGFDTVYY